MKHSTLTALPQPEGKPGDMLTELLRAGARDLIAHAVEAELAIMLEQHRELRLPDGRQAVVRNGYLPQRTIQTGIGDVEIKVPKVRDRSGSGINFTSTLLPPYLKRSRSIEELLPWLYLKGISSGDYQEALCALLGDQAKGLSANTVCRLKQGWIDEHQRWRQRDLTKSRYVYWWADGIYSNVRMDDRLCLLVIIGVTEHGRKELVAVEDGHRESETSWTEVLMGLRGRGLTLSPKLAIGDGALGFWKALAKCYPDTAHQRCWVHKTANVLSVLPKSVQPKVKEALHDIWMAETREDAHKAFDRTLTRFEAKYPGAMDKLVKDRDELLAFYDFPAEHWVSIRTTNPIESTFSTVRLRTKRARNCGSRETTLAMVYKLLESAQKNWKRLKGFALLTLVVNNVKFKDGIQMQEESDRNAA
ncbi:IS256 family transposase [Aeromonas caviae]|uniref:IS256 family transposase n=1 Tax=Aeromonas caviae TaxID=648 RepID=UPI001C5652D2|nr:IS256 family transposase [Aeromonas caviae]QXW27995.1 IS256 family transposase [Aeromonas sanarellii]QXW28129.1 IS256 family transposase [Aeromonas sanarellii]QXW28697.1 IS256 family transposase [Aeromonas sanarellii]QXW30369.1 IS256 family transposase [Aeromonas sanarellii]QXW30691.1 IS256 family transposase [Aeromonas sanarellii]